MGNILLGAKAYICDEHDFVANKRKVLLLGLCLLLAFLTLLSLNSRVIIITLDKTVLAKLYSGSCEQASQLLHFSTEFYLFLISIQFSSTYLNRRPLCEVDLSSVIVTKGISVVISLAFPIARQYEIKNSRAELSQPS